MNEHFVEMLFNSIPCYTSEFIPENTVVIMNKKTGANKIIDYEETIKDLESQISSLKSQLADIKYLSRGEVEKILTKGLIFEYDEIFSRYGICNLEDIITAILKLAIKPDREKIIEVLDKNTEQITYMPENKGAYNEMAGDNYLGRISDVIHRWQFPKIANKIIEALEE